VLDEMILIVNFYTDIQFISLINNEPLTQQHDRLTFKKSQYVNSISSKLNQYLQAIKNRRFIKPYVLK